MESATVASYPCLRFLQYMWLTSICQNCHFMFALCNCFWTSLLWTLRGRWRALGGKKKVNKLIVPAQDSTSNLVCKEKNSPASQSTFKSDCFQKLLSGNWLGQQGTSNGNFATREKFSLGLLAHNFQFCLCTFVFHLASSKPQLSQPDSVKEHFYLEA